MKKAIFAASAALVLLLSSFNLYASEFKNWILAYHHDNSGNPISGSLNDLVTAIQNGADVRIGFGIVDGKPTSFREEGTLIYNTASSTPEVTLTTKIPSINHDSSNNLTLVAGRYAQELFSTRGVRMYDSYIISSGATDGPRITQSQEIFWYISK